MAENGEDKNHRRKIQRIKRRQIRTFRTADEERFRDDEERFRDYKEGTSEP